MARTLTSRRGEGTRSAGFSLLELIVVLLLLGLASVLIAPSFTGGLSGLQLETSTRDLITLMRHARSEAIAKQQVFRVVVGQEDPLSTKYVLANDFGETIQEKELPKGFRFLVADDFRLPLTVSFYPNGRSTGAAFGIRNKQGKTTTITVDPVTGFAKLEKKSRAER
jgi:prepilin-type N-terminal cleavage/methylation domain-containing protein